MRTIAVFNQKGGVGKTTVAVNLAAALAVTGRRILLIDMDPQAHSTTSFLDRVDDDERTIYQLLRSGSKLTPEEASHDTYIPGLQIIPSERRLSALRLRDHLRLAEVLAAVDEDLDYILIDCPPELGYRAINALYASGVALIPMQCREKPLEGLVETLETLDGVREDAHPITRGILLNEVERTTICREIADGLRSALTTDILRTEIRRNVDIQMVERMHRPIILQRPASRGAQDFEALTREVIIRWP